MINCSEYHGMYAQGNGNLAVLPRVYIMHRNGLLKSCYHDEALALLASGKWYDITHYEPNEEVLTYEKQISSPEPTTSSDGQEPEHQQRECVAVDGEREKSNRKTNGPRSPNSKIKKRGRPKASK